MSMHVYNQPLQAKATVEINIVATQRVAARLQNQYRKQMEVIHVRTCVGSSGQMLVANEELF